MRNRILSIVLALSLIAVLFAALPTKAAITTTGTVMTTDVTGAARTDFLKGEFVYVKVMVQQNGAPANVLIYVNLVPATDTTDLNWVSSLNNQSNDPAAGWYNSSTAHPARHLATDAFFTGDVRAYNVIVRLGAINGPEIARTQIVVRAVGLTLTPSPNNPAYWPGEQISMRLVVTQPHTADVFYIQVVNSTYDESGINITGQSATTGFWTGSFTISSTMPDGTYHIRVRPQSLTDTSVWENQSFKVQSYEFMAQPQRDSYLPGETANVTYLVLDLATLTRLTSGVTIEYSAEYANKTGNLTWQNGTLDVANTLWQFLLPTNGTAKTSIGLFSNIDVTLWAKQASGDRNVSDSFTIDIGRIAGSVAVDRTNYAPGDTVEVTVSANVLGDHLDGAMVDVTVWKNGTDLVSAYGATGLTTNQDGTATYVFKLSNSAEMGLFNYIVKATISKVGYSAVRETQFGVSTNSHLAVALDQAYYYGGQEATATFAAFLNNLPTTTTTVGYIFEMGPSVLATGNTTGNSATVMIPQGSFGTLDVIAFTHINGQIVSGFAAADVHFALLGLTSERTDYRPGDTVVFQWTIVTGQPSASLAYEVLDNHGVRVANGTPAFAKTGSFEITVPAAGPLLPTSYSATLRMTTPEGGFASDSATVNIVDTLELIVSVGKSSYTSGEFAPGQKITIHYNLASYLMTAPSSIRLEVSVDNDPNVYEFIVDSPTGTIPYTLLKTAPMGPTDVTVTAFDAANGGPSIGSDTTTIVVNNQVSGWDSSVGGLSAIDLVLLILLIIVIIMLIVVPYMKDRMARPKPPESKPMQMSEPSDSGKTPPAP